MRKKLCLLLFCLLSATACTPKPESNILGEWVLRGVTSMEFKGDHTGVLRDPGGTTRFTWSLPRKDVVEVKMDFLPTSSVYNVRGDKLICSETPEYYFAKKK